MSENVSRRDFLSGAVVTVGALGTSKAFAQDRVVAPMRPARDASRMGAVERQETVVALGEVLSIGKIEKMISRGELILPLDRGVAVFGTNQNILGSSPDWQRSVLLAFRAGKEDSTSNLRLLDFCRRFILAAEIQIAAGQDMDVLIRNIGATNHTIRLSDLVSMVKSTLTAGLISLKLPDAQAPDGLGSGEADTSVDLSLVQSFLDLYGVSLPGLEDPKQ